MGDFMRACPVNSNRLLIGKPYLCMICSTWLAMLMNWEIDGQRILKVARS